MQTAVALGGAIGDQCTGVKGETAAEEHSLVEGLALGCHLINGRRRKVLLILMRQAIAAGRGRRPALRSGARLLLLLLPPRSRFLFPPERRR